MHAPPAWPFLTAALLVIAAPALADISPPPFPSAAGPQPMGTTDAEDLSMKHEEVILELHDPFVIVDATFTLSNSGKARTMKVGFPGHGVSVLEGHGRHPGLVGFSAWVNGRKVPDEAQKTEHCEPACKEPWTETWHVFSVSFPKGPTKIRVRYGVLTESSGWAALSVTQPCDARSAWYILSTGERWSGPIGEAVIRIRARGGVKQETLSVIDGHMQSKPAPAAEEPASSTLPDYAVRDASGVTLRRQQLEPTKEDNLEILYCPDPARLPSGTGEGDTAPVTQQLLEALRRPAPKAGDKSP